MDLEKTNTFYLVPKDVLENLVAATQYLDLLREKLENEQGSEVLGDYVTECMAGAMLGRGKTWFHNKRKSNELPGKKAAGRWYYKRQDLINYIESGN